MILAEHYQAVLDGTMTPEQATEAAIADITSREGAVNGFLDALGVAGGVAAGVPACGSGILTAGCIAAAAATAASANHLYADVRQVITGKEAKTALHDCLVKVKGMDPAEADTWEHYVDTGAIVVTLVAGGYAFAVNATAAGKAATVLEGLEGKTFGGDLVRSRTLTTNVPSSGRKFNQLTSRGWDQSSIDDVVNNPAHTSAASNRATGNPATAYFDKEGNYVVRDDVTGDLVQLSNRNDPDWMPDLSISDPYRP